MIGNPLCSAYKSELIYLSMQGIMSILEFRSIACNNQD